MSHELVLLQTKADYEAEGQKLHHAVGYFFDTFQQSGTKVYSLRTACESVLTLSVQAAGYTDHIVGLDNRAPTPAEFDILAPLLADLGIENRYDPLTLR